MRVQDWFNGVSFTVPNELSHFDEFGDHPQFVGWSYGSDHNVVYVSYSDGSEIRYDYFCNSWTC